VRIDGRLIGLFSLDVGYEIDLGRARQLTEHTESGDLERRRAAPAHTGYTAPPLRVALGERELTVAQHPVKAKVSAVVHEFGSVTIKLEMPLTADVDELPQLTSTLSSTGSMEGVARAALDEFYRQLEPAITKPGRNEFIEDYYVLQCDRIEPPMSIDEFLAQARKPIASALRCEAEPLSAAEIEDVLRSRLSYYPSDLILTEWNVALIVDRDYTDAVNVLEHLNVQLLELRYHDALLDKRVAASYDLANKAAPVLPFDRSYRRAVEELATIRIDVAAIVERIHNALKLGGDLYLAKVYERTAERLGLATWEQSVAAKLEVLQQMYSVFVQRVTTARAELLELTIIFLIAVEIFLFMAGWG
jgi:hypothetical protein